MPVFWRATPLPTPGMPEHIESQSSLAGAVPRQDGLAAEICGQGEGKFLRTCLVPSNQWNDLISACIQDQDGGILHLALQQRSHQAGDGTNCAYHQQLTTSLPVLRKQSCGGFNPQIFPAILY